MGKIIARKTKKPKADGSFAIRYTARVRLKGVYKCKTFRTETHAKNWIEREEAQIKKDSDEGVLVVGNYTMKDAIEAYKEHQLEHLSSKTWQSVIAKIEEHMGDLPLTRIRQVDILNARSKYRKSRVPFLSNSSCNKFTTCIRNILRLARRLNMMAHDPFKEYERLDEKGSVRTRYLKEEERLALLNAAKQSRNPHLWVIINVAIMTGFRKNTIRYLRWSNVDLQGNMIRLSNAAVNEERKRGKPRCPNVPIVPALKDILKEHHAKYGSYEFVFPSLEQPNCPIDFRSAWRVAVKNTKIHDFKFHDLRGTAATYLGMMKVPLHIIQQILGHSDPKMTIKYVQTVEDTVSAEMTRVFETIFKSEPQ